MAVVNIHGDFWAKKIKSSTVSSSSPSVYLEIMGVYTTILVFWMLSFKPIFSLLSFTLIKRVFQFSSVAQSCSTLCDTMNRSTPGLPVHHKHPEFTQTHIHRVSDAIQPSHPLSSPSPATAKSLQSCPTLCDSTDGSPPGSPVPGILQARILEWAAISSCPQSLPASESFPMSQFFARGGQSTGVSALASVLPKNTQGWSPLEWTSWISLQSKGLSRVSSNTTVQKHQFFSAQLSSQSNSHIHIRPLEKP